MRLGRFEIQGKIIYGIFTDREVVPLESLTGDNTLISCFGRSLNQLQEEMDEYTGMTYNLSDLKVLAPMDQTARNMFCLGKNYRDHALEMKGKTTDAVVVPTSPIYFSKASSTLIGPGEWITGHVGITQAVDYEVELAIIIGKAGKNIPKSAVKDHIFGYTIVNDVSARDLQIEHIQWHKGKSLDGFSPMGPYVLLRDAIPYPPDLKIECRVNDELRQSSRTNNLIFDVDTLISDLSQGMTLVPGDIILTGTPSGVGMGFDPPKYLKSGDKITCEIEKIGVLENYLK